MIFKDSFLPGPIITIFRSTLGVYISAWIFPFKTNWQCNMMYHKLQPVYFYSNHIMNFYHSYIVSPRHCNDQIYIWQSSHIFHDSSKYTLWTWSLSEMLRQSNPLLTAKRHPLLTSSSAISFDVLPILSHIVFLCSTSI